MYRPYKKEEYFSKKAREEGYPARSVYKLQEIDEKYEIIKKGDIVLDLGCSPGSWFLYISKKVGSKGKVIGLDIEDIKIDLPANTTFLKNDILRDGFDQVVGLKLKFDAIVSDMASSTSGIKELDSARSLELCQKAFELAKSLLVERGNFVCKIFEGLETTEFIEELKGYFKIVKRFRPKAVLKRSKEFYLICKGFRSK